MDSQDIGVFKSILDILSSQDVETKEELANLKKKINEKTGEINSLILNLADKVKKLEEQEDSEQKDN